MILNAEPFSYAKIFAWSAVYLECIHGHGEMCTDNKRRNVKSMAQSRKQDASPDSYICQKEHPHINIHPNEPMENEKKRHWFVCTSIYLNLISIRRKSQAMKL